MRRLLALGLVLVLASPAWAGLIIINDDFESYADTAALNAVWPKGAGTDADTYLLVGDNGPTWPGEKCVENTLILARRDQGFTPYQLAANEEIIWAFDFKDTVGPTGASYRQYGQILSAASPGGALNELLAIGVYNSVTKPGEVFNPNKYQARIAFGPGQGWFNLNANRSVGWHRFEVHIKPTTVDYYVDGAPDIVGLPHAGLYWYQARIGSAVSSAAGMARYDNYGVEVIPEPAALLLLALGGLVLRRR